MMSDEKQLSEQTRVGVLPVASLRAPQRMALDSRQLLVAACVAVVACLISFGLVSGEETAPATPVAPQKTPCKLIDCRDPL